VDYDRLAIIFQKGPETDNGNKPKLFNNNWKIKVEFDLYSERIGMAIQQNYYY
jgi:hypothetical protein